MASCAGTTLMAGITTTTLLRKSVREKSTLPIFAALEMWDTSNKAHRALFRLLFFISKRCIGSESFGGSLNPSLRSGLASLRSASSICLGFGRPSEGDLEEILLTARRRWTDAAGRNGSLYPKRKDKADGRTHTLYKGVSVQGPVHHRCP